MAATSRRDFLRRLGISTAALPFALNLPSLCFANQFSRKQRLVFGYQDVHGKVPR